MFRKVKKSQERERRGRDQKKETRDREHKHGMHAAQPCSWKQASSGEDRLDYGILLTFP